MDSSKFNKVNVMILDCYNMVLMAQGVEARLFRQVHSACMLLANTDMLPLHVHYMLALYIVSCNYNISCCISSKAYICSHEIHDAQCANCKGKMVDGSEISGTFWLLVRNGSSNELQ